MSEHAALLHNMSVPPKSVVKYEGLSALGSTFGANNKNTAANGPNTSPAASVFGLFGKPIGFSLDTRFRGLPVSKVLLQMGLVNDLETGAITEQEAERQLIDCINRRADELPLPDGCAVLAAHSGHALIWQDSLTLLAVLSKCTDTVWLRSKTPLLYAALQGRAVSLLVPPSFVVQLPEVLC